MVISRKQNKPFHPQLYMNDIPISEVETHKHLVTLFSSDCNWKSHVHQIMSKASKRIAILRKLKFKIDRLSLFSLLLDQS